MYSAARYCSWCQKLDQDAFLKSFFELAKFPKVCFQMQFLVFVLHFYKNALKSDYVYWYARKSDMKCWKGILDF